MLAPEQFGLVLIPILDARNRGFKTALGMRVFPRSYPVNAGQQFHAERCFESFDQLGNAGKTLLGAGMVLQVDLGRLRSTGEELNRRGRFAPPIADPPNVMPF